MATPADLRMVLVVDDSPHDYETYVRYLQRAATKKYSTKFLSLGREVFSKINGDRPDCMLLDLSLPDMSGLEIISKLKELNQEKLPFPVVMVTGSGDEHTGEKAVGLGAQDYLLKEEVTEESLPRSIEFAIARFSLEQKLRASEEQQRLVAQNLRESEERYRQLAAKMKMAADASGLGFWAWDIRTGEIDADENNRRVLSLPLSGPVTYWDFVKMIHEEDRAELQRVVEASLKNASSYDHEFRVKDPDGSIRWIAARGSVFTDARGKVIGLRGMGIDITPRKNAEAERDSARERERQLTKEAAAANAKFRAVFEQTPVFAGIMDLEGTLIDANRLSLEACGYRPEEVLGKPFWETAWWRGAKAVQEKVRVAAVQALEGKPSRQILNYRCASGLQRLVDFSIHPILDQQGHVLFLHPIGIDITDVKLAEERLRVSEQKFSKAFAGNPAAIALSRLEDGLFVDVNDTWLELNGRSREETIGQSARLMGVWPSPEAAHRFVEELREKGSVRGWHQEFRKKSGEPFIAEVSAQIIMLHGQKHVLSTLIDITERKRMEAELETARGQLEQRVIERTQELANAVQKLEGEMAARIESEKRLRELSACLLRMQDEERRRIARDLHDSTGQTLTALKISLCTLESSLQSDPDKGHLILNDINVLAEQALSEIRTTSYLLHPPLLDESGFCSAAEWYIDGFSKRSGIRVQLDLQQPPQRPPISVETVLFRILQESLTNIVRHSGSKTAEVSLRCEDHCLRLEIRDHGKGIDAERLRKFAATGSGMGVGLAGMRERVREAGGTLAIQSERYGTSVKVSIGCPEEIKLVQRKVG